jgi:hypothetical protein
MFIPFAAAKFRGLIRADIAICCGMNRLEGRIVPQASGISHKKGRFGRGAGMAWH